MSMPGPARERAHRGRRWLLLVSGLVAATILSVQPATAASYLAIDHFGREVSSGWGEAQPGGLYSLSGPAADFWVSTAEYARGLGYMNAPRAGQSRAVLLRNAQGANVEIGFSVGITGPEFDGPYYAYAITRSGAGREVRAKIVFNRSCTVSMNASVLDGGEKALGPLATVPNARWCGPNRTGRTMTLRAQVSGNTVSISAWSPNNQPSGWQWSATSNLLPASGAVGLRVYVSSSAAQGAVFKIYNWYARTI
jgi:hypothetical protein